MHLRTPVFPKKFKTLTRVLYVSFLFLCIVIALTFTGLLYTKQLVFDLLWYTQKQANNDVYVIEPFPISVYPAEKKITEVENLNTQPYFQNKLSDRSILPSFLKNKKIFAQIVDSLSQLHWYQNLASPSSRILIIRPGERKEEVINTFAKILNWDQQMKETFESLVVSAAPPLAEGKFFPDNYLVSKDATPEKVADIIIQNFNSEIAIRYTDDIQKIVPLKEALTIASILEREAYDFTDMREISGIIWNRLFIDMPLQIDATLQYANGTSHSKTWYPKVTPEDKYIESPYNTYRNKDLPPTPIGSPSVEAVLAALNPVPTDCLFYFHDKNSQFHCSKTYKEHVRLLKKYYGQGK